MTPSVSKVARRRGHSEKAASELRWFVSRWLATVVPGMKGSQRSPPPGRFRRPAGPDGGGRDRPERRAGARRYIAECRYHRPVALARWWRDGPAKRRGCSTHRRAIALSARAAPGCAPDRPRRGAHAGGDRGVRGACRAMAWRRPRSFALSRHAVAFTSRFLPKGSLEGSVSSLR